MDMDIDNLEAGPELDKLVAERVMGLVPCTHWVDGFSTMSIIHGDECDGTPYLNCHDAKPGRWTKKYSTDIAAAWEVVEKFKPEVEICCLHNGTYRAWLGAPLKTEWHGFAPIAPLAICRAALKAVIK